MIIDSLKAENSALKGELRAGLSDGSTLLFSVFYLPDGKENPAISETGRELSSAEEEALRFASVCCRAERIALRLISRAEQCSLGLTVKLQRRGLDSAAVNAVISRLFEEKLLDDLRYAELWLRSKLRSRKAPGPRRLSASLAKKGIARDSLGKALGNALDPETEYELLLRFLENGKLPGEKKGISRRAYLKFEGFSSAVIERYFDENS